MKNQYLHKMTIFSKHYILGRSENQTGIGLISAVPLMQTQASVPHYPHTPKELLLLLHPAGRTVRTTGSEGRGEPVFFQFLSHKSLTAWKQGLTYK